MSVFDFVPMMANPLLRLLTRRPVVLMEPQLTTTSEDQAIARAYRMGQTQRVIVHRLLAQVSVDERIHELLGEKEALFDEYARESEAKERAPESMETAFVQRIMDMEAARLGDGAEPEDSRLRSGETRL